MKTCFKYIIVKQILHIKCSHITFLNPILIFLKSQFKIRIAWDSMYSGVTVIAVILSVFFLVKDADKRKEASRDILLYCSCEWFRPIIRNDVYSNKANDKKRKGNECLPFIMQSFRSCITRKLTKIRSSLNVMENFFIILC